MKREIKKGCYYYWLDDGYRLRNTIVKVVDITEEGKGVDTKVHLLKIDTKGSFYRFSEKFWFAEDNLCLTCSVSNLKQIKEKAKKALIERCQEIDAF